MFFLHRLLAKQFRKPTGPLAGWVSQKMKTRNREVYDWTLSLVALSPSDNVLEVGYGPGHGIEQIARIVENGPGSVFGVDFSPAMFKQASRRNRTAIENGDVCLMMGCADKTSFPDDRFDAIIGINVVYFFDDPPRCLGELRRVLRPGGRAAFYLTDGADMGHLPDAYFQKYSGNAFAKIMIRAGFEKVAIHTRELAWNGQHRTGHCVIGEKPVGTDRLSMRSMVRA